MIKELYKPGKPENFALFWGLLRRIPCTDRDALKEQLVSEFTEGRTASLREVTLAEYRDMTLAMERMAAPEPRERRLARLELRRGRSSVLHQMQLLGVDTADWSAVDRLCLQGRIAGKRFRELDTAELRAVFLRLRMIASKRKEK